MASVEMINVPIRVAGFPNFEVELPLSSTISDAKIAATTGCDIDPDEMRMVFRGKVLRDEATLESCGVNGKDALCIARCRQSTAAAPSSGSDSATTAAASTSAAREQTKASIQITLKGPGGLDKTLTGISTDDSVEQLRDRAGELCSCTREQIHLLHKGKILRDGVTLAQSGVQHNDILRVARRGSHAQDSASRGYDNAANTNDMESDAATAMGPMPMAWSSGGNAGLDAQQQQILRQLGFTGASPEQVAAALENRTAARPGVGIVRDEAREQQERLNHEVRIMEHHVRRLVRERLQASGNRIGPDEEIEEDPEMLNEIARVMAEARSRGAPVPNADRFVERALNRSIERRARQERLRREAGDMDPDLEDAVAAAERIAHAAERAPRRLGRE